MRLRSISLLLCVGACDPDLAHDPKYAYGEIAQVCATRYVAPTAGDLVDLTLQIDDTMDDFELQSVCVLLDDGAVMLTNAFELRPGALAIRHISVTKGEHRLAFAGAWKKAGASSHGRRGSGGTPTPNFDLRSTHVFDTTRTTFVRGSAYEISASAVEERPKFVWYDTEPAR